MSRNRFGETGNEPRRPSGSRPLRKRKNAKAKAKAKGKHTVGKFATRVKPHHPKPPKPLGPCAADEPEPVVFPPEDSAPPAADHLPEPPSERPPEVEFHGAAASSGSGGVPAVPAARVRIYTTPQLLKTLCPPHGLLSIDIPACRWRARIHGETLPSVGFGPFCPYNRRQALVRILDDMWMSSGDARPASAYVHAVAEAAWDGLLDERVEQPRKYQKKW